MQLHGVAPRIPAEEPGGALVGAQQTQQHPDGGGLAGAVGPQEAVDLAGCDLEVEVVERDHAPESLGEGGGVDDGFGHGASSSSAAAYTARSWS